MSNIQQQATDDLVRLSREVGREVEIYKDKKGNILITEMHEHGLFRTIVDRCGKIECLGSGAVGIKRWTKVEKLINA